MRRVIMAGVVLVMLGALPTARAGVVIQAKVNGMNEDIGDLDAVIDPANAARVIGTFKFDPKFAFLDGWYDFRWVNIQTEYILDGMAQMNDPVLGKLPAVDPQPPPTNPNEDNKPFYYNDGEWLPPGQMFGGQIIHEEGKASRFVDRPSDGMNNSLIKFMTYLVVTNVSDPNFPKDEFLVLGVFDWEYDNKGNSANGVSTVKRVAGTPTIMAADINLISTAIGNAGKDGFGKWKANTPFSYGLVTCPEPGTLALLVIGGSLAGLAKLRRMRAA